MDPARWRRVEEICVEALDRTGDERMAFVAAACGDDETLRQEVDALLVQAASSATLLGATVGDVAAQVLGDGDGPSLIGRQIGCYTVLSLLGAGGMGEVYRAHDARLARDVAIKILPADPTPDRSHSRRFRREAQAIAGLNHPHICVVHDVGEQDGLSYLVMEYLDGQTLRARLQDPAPLPLPDGLTIAIDVAGALVEAHRHGIVHRDVKPGNIMLTARGTKLLDFGLARPVAAIDAHSTHALTSAGVVLGTPHYMSPEQARGQPVDARSDIFSLGAVIYEMVTGCRPFNGGNVIDIIDAVLHQEPRAVSERRPEAPAILGSLIAKCLAKDKDERYASVEQLWTDLLDVRQGTAPRVASLERDATELYASDEVPEPRRSTAPFTYVLPARGLVVGRDAEIDAGFEQWMKDRSKPLLIWGPPGIGKSTLALSILHHPEAARRFGARRFLIRCDGFTQAESVQTGMGSEWFGLAAGPRIAGEVLAQLAAGPAAVVLDNFETPHRADSERSEEWLRRVVGIPDVWLIVAVQGHEAPGGLEWARRMEPGRLTPKQSRTLFCRIASMEVDRTEMLDGLLKELDGVPHAIELLAHQAEEDSDLSSLVDRWRRQRTSLLRRGIGATRQTNVAISYEFAIASPAMSDATLRMLRILASLPSGLADDDVPIAMEEVSGVTARDAASTLKRCALAFTEGDRLRMLAPLREHVLKAHPAAAVELLPVRERFLRMASSGWEIGKTDSGSHTLAMLTREHLNCRWAIEAALDASDVSVAESAFGLGNFTRYSGVGGTDIVERAARVAHRLDDRSGEALCIECLGDIAWLRSDYDDARLRYEQARPIYKEVGDRRSEAICIKRVGDIAVERSEHAFAQHCYEDALRIFRELGVRLGEATCIHGLGNVALQRYDHPSARRQYEEAMAIYHEVDARQGKASCLHRLGDLAFMRNDYSEAQGLYEEALTIFRKIGSRVGAAHSILNLGNVALVLGDLASAEGRFEDARGIFREVLDRRGEAMCVHGLGDLASGRGDYASACQQYESVLRIYRDVGDPHSEAVCILRLAETAVNRRDYGEAETRFEEARRLFQQTEDGPGEVNVIYGIGAVALGRGEYEEARKHFEQAQTMYRGRGVRRGDVMCMQRLGDVALAVGNRGAARDWYDQALAGFRSVQDRPAIGESLLRLARLEERTEPRCTLLRELVQLWNEIDRQDRIDNLAREFPGDVQSSRLR